MRDIISASKGASNNATVDLRLEAFVSECFDLAMQGDTTQWDIVNEALAHEGMCFKY